MDIKTKLEFALPKGKLPCIIIRFKTLYEAANHNSKAIYNHSNQIFNLKFHISAIQQNLDIYLTVGDYEYRYKNVLHSNSEIYKFLYLTTLRNTKMFSFCHIANDEGKSSIPKVGLKKKIWVLNVSKVELIEED